MEIFDQAYEIETMKEDAEATFYINNVNKQQMEKVYFR